ncbi:MAG: hypothetical protein L6Q57_04975 [Alphaproteobacteria bacterium]|nr:hypothetical protein [Alphaproteobacteria bacterium]
MSFSKEDRLFPSLSGPISDPDLAIKIATALRRDFGDSRHAIKRIGKLTGANLRTIKNWYNARHSPSSNHLLTLSRMSKEILRIVLEEIGGKELLEAAKPLIEGSDSPKSGHLNGAKVKIYSARFCTINVTVDLNTTGQINQRQLWFMGMLQQGHRIKAEEIARTWDVSQRTAKYDVAGLMDTGLVKFIGAKKTGWYAAAK